MQYIKVVMSLSDVSKSIYRVQIKQGISDCSIFGREITLYINENNTDMLQSLDKLVETVEVYQIKHLVIQTIRDTELREMIKQKFKDIDIMLYECSI